MQKIPYKTTTSTYNSSNLSWCYGNLNAINQPDTKETSP